jgi:hypothetical protein
MAENETPTQSTETPAQTTATAETPAAPATPTVQDRRERLRQAGQELRAAREAARNPTTAPAAAQAATGAPAAAAATPAPDASAPGSPGEAKPKALDAWAKVAQAQRDLELAKQEHKRQRDAFEAEQNAKKATLELAGKFAPLEDLKAKKDDAAIMQLIYGDEWREAWLRLTSAMAPEPTKPLSAAEAEEIAARKFEALRKAEAEKRTSESRTRTEEGLTKYIGRVRELAEAAAGKYPSITARGSYDNRERFRQILTEEYTKNGQLPDPQVVLDRIETEDTAFFRKALPYAVQAVPDAQTASGPVATITPALRQGGPPPQAVERPTSIQASREAAMARLRGNAQQQRQP